MTNYFLISIYVLSIFAIFIIPIYINVKQNRVVALSFLPIFLIASTASSVFFISSFFDDKSLVRAGCLVVFIFLEFIIFGYLMMFPILILTAFIVEYLRIYYHYETMKLAFIGGIISSIIVGIIFGTWKFIWAALISGFIAVWLQYYLTEYKNQEKDQP